MKRLLTAVLLVALLTISSAALASYGTPAVYLLDETGQWLSPPYMDPNGLHAKAFTSDGKEGICDKEVWSNTFTNHATVSQWINYSFGGTRWDWQIRKPGTFATDCIEFHIQSNDDVAVAFDGFEDLAPLLHPEAPAIPAFYAYADLPADGSATDDPPAEADWLSAADLNTADFTLA